MRGAFAPSDPHPSNHPAEGHPPVTRTVARSLVLTLACLYLLGALSVALGGSAFVEGPLPSKTGARAVGGKPGEPNCTQCHQTYDDFGSLINRLNTPGGGVKILDLPANYEAGKTYPLRVQLATDSTASFPDRRWGFEMTAVRASDGEGAGTWVLSPGDNLQIVIGNADFGSRAYVEHSFDATHEGSASPVEWSLQWKAPDVAAGTIYFFCAGNSANGNLGNDGDFIFTTSDSVADLTSPTVSSSWGALKTRFRR